MKRLASRVANKSSGSGLHRAAVIAGATVSGIIASTTATQAEGSFAEESCVVYTGNPNDPNLNIRSAPMGRIIGEYAGGQVVQTIGLEKDTKNRDWSQTPDGWVLRKYLDCSIADSSEQNETNSSVEIIGPASVWHNHCTAPLWRIASSNPEFCTVEIDSFECRAATKGEDYFETGRHNLGMVQSSTYTISDMKSAIGSYLICSSADLDMGKPHDLDIGPINGAPSEDYYRPLDTGESVATSVVLQSDGAQVGGCSFGRYQWSEWTEQVRFYCHHENALDLPEGPNVCCND